MADFEHYLHDHGQIPVLPALENTKSKVSIKQVTYGLHKGNGRQPFPVLMLKIASYPTPNVN